MSGLEIGNALLVSNRKISIAGQMSCHRRRTSKAHRSKRARASTCAGSISEIGLVVCKTGARVAKCAGGRMRCVPLVYASSEVAGIEGKQEAPWAIPLPAVGDFSSDEGMLEGGRGERRFISRISCLLAGRTEVSRCVTTSVSCLSAWGALLDPVSV